MDRRLFLLGAPLALAACAEKEAVWSSDEMVRRNATPRVGAPSVKLITIKNVGSGNGAHTALLINASQRVLWDPAGSFKSPSIAERNDVIFGMSPQLESYYYSFHSRTSYYTIIQEISVPEGVAEGILRDAMAYGNVPDAQCTQSTAEILKRQTMFQSVGSSLFPNNLHDDFAKLPGVKTHTIYENDSDDLSEAARALRERIANGQG